MSYRATNARDRVVAAALGYVSASWYSETNPDDPHGGAGIELHADVLDDALTDYVDEVNRERAGKLVN